MSFAENNGLLFWPLAVSIGYFIVGFKALGKRNSPGYLYFDEACQIHMPTWTNGRIALVGDAAHAPSFFTGMGTSLALQGATLIAKGLHANDDYKIAFGNYNDTFKPYAESIQARIFRGLKVHILRDINLPPLLHYVMNYQWKQFARYLHIKTLDRQSTMRRLWII